MKIFLKLGIVLSVVVLSQLLFVQAEIPPDENTKLTEIQRWINQADSLAEAKNLDSAIVIGKMVLEKINQEYGESDSIYTTMLRRMGDFYHCNNKEIEALSYYERWLTITKRKPGADRSSLANMTNLLGRICRESYRLPKAEVYLKQTLQILENEAELDNNSLAGCLKELGTVYMLQLRYAEAEAVLKKALEASEKASGPETYLHAEIMNKLGNLYLNQSRYNEAEPLYKKGLEIRKKIGGPEEGTLSESLNNLGIIYESQGRYAEAESSYAQALRIREKALGPRHPYLIYALVNLGELYALRGNYAKADSFYNRALKIVEKAYGPDHLHAAWSRSALGDLYRYQGKYLEAEQFYTRAFDINKKTFGFDHPMVANSLNKLALLYGSTGEYSKSLAKHEKLLECKQNLIENVFSYASEAQKIRYADKYALIDHSLLSLAIFDVSKESKSCALEMILKGKAVVIDAVSAEKEIAYCSYDNKIIQTEKQLSDVSSEISTMSMASITGSLPKEYRDSLQILYVIKDSLETQLSRSCSDFRDELAVRRFKVTDVANALPEGAVLWEFIRYEPYDFKKVGNDKERTGSPRYLAFTLDHEANIRLTDLGDAGEIDSLVSLARRQIYNARVEVYSSLVVESEKRLNEVTGKLYNIFFAPLEFSIGDRADIFISPDGQLNLLPFEILPCPDGEYVIEKFKISYLSSGRDLLRFKKKRTACDWALVMADPDFDLSEETLSQHRDKTLKKSGVFSFGYEPSRGVGGCLNNRFNPLPYSREETKSVTKTLNKKANLKVQSYQGGDALEEVLKGISTAPRVLHLATHGYFCEDVDLVENKMLENPLLRSGLALAGANGLMDEKPKDDTQTEDGILTAFEASGLNLIGTELVTLSACETGVGQVKNGEGVYGLRRAFQHAGARTIVMSLWKVPDKETGELMDDFYKNWSTGQTKKQALRQSALKVLKACKAKYGAAHPLFWGAFVMVGNPN